MTKTKISIVVPVYNAEAFIERCVESILKQTYHDFELILVDDGSKDASLAICRKLQQKDNRIQVFTKSNGGPSSARKLGVEKATGNYIFFVDSDDTIPNDALENLLSKNKNQSLDIIQGARKFVPADKSEGHISNFINEEIIDSSTYVKYLFQGYVNIGPVATLYKRKLFGPETYDLPDDVRVGEDFYMNVCLGLQAGKIGLFNDLTYNYIENCKSSTHTYQFTSLIPQKHLLECIRRELIKAGLFERFSLLFYSKAIGALSSACFHNRSLIYDEYCTQIAKETKGMLLSRRGKALRFMLMHPSSYILFYLANKLRQYFS